jgi:chromosome segregation ATPase
MMGTASVSTDTLSGLLRLVKDPESVQAHLDQIKKAEDDYKATVAKAQADLITQRTQLDSQRTAQNTRETALSKRESEVAARETQSAAAAAALDKERSEFKAFEAQTSARLAEQEQALKNRIKALESEQAEWVKQRDVRDKALSDREGKSAALMRDLKAREADLEEAVTAHDRRSAALRAALGDPRIGVSGPAAKGLG